MRTKFYAALACFKRFYAVFSHGVHALAGSRQRRSVTDAPFCQATEGDGRRRQATEAVSFTLSASFLSS
jgi:hypothetical protein